MAHKIAVSTPALTSEQDFRTGFVSCSAGDFGVDHATFDKPLEGSCVDRHTRHPVRY